MPTGGITLQNAPRYLQTPGILCCGGSFIAPSGLIKNNAFQTIESNARQVRTLMDSLSPSSNQTTGSTANESV